MVLRPMLNCILSAALLVSLAGCYRLPDGPPEAQSQPPTQSTPQTIPQTTGTLTLAWYPQRTLHPVLGDDRVNLTLAPLLYEGLFELDTRFTPQNVLCDSYSVSQDGLVWSFQLKGGVTFSDGTPLTAAIAAGALELARTSARFSSRLSDVSSITGGQGLALTVTLSRPNTALPALLDIPIALDAGNQPLGTGPYILSPDGKRLVSRTQNADLPYEINLTPIDHYTDLTGGFGPEGSLSLADADLNAADHPGFADLYACQDYDTTTLVYLGFNTTRGVVRSAAARTALSQALDRSALISVGFGGHALATTLPIHPASPLYDESLARQLTAAQPAAELLEQAGLTGKTVTLLVNRDNRARLTAAQHMARQLEKAGMTVKLSAPDWSGYLSALANGQFDVYLGETTLRTDFDLSALVSGESTINYTRWSSGETNRLLTALRTAAPETRAQAARDLCADLAEKCPIAPICFKRGSVLTRPGLSLTLTPTRANVFYGRS